MGVEGPRVGFAFAAGALADAAVLEPAVGGLLVVLGVGTASGQFDRSVDIGLPERRRSAGGFFLFGVVYGVAAAGCTAPIFVGLALFALGSGPLGAVVVLGSYAAGMATLMVAVTLLSAVGRTGLLRTLSRNTGRVPRLAGSLLALAGVALIYLFVFDFDYRGILRLLRAGRPRTGRLTPPPETVPSPLGCARVALGPGLTRRSGPPRRPSRPGPATPRRRPSAVR